MSDVLQEKHVSIDIGTYGRYIGSNPANYFLFPVTVLLFVASEIILTFFLRFLEDDRREAFAELCTRIGVDPAGIQCS